MEPDQGLPPATGIGSESKDSVQGLTTSMEEVTTHPQITDSPVGQTPACIMNPNSLMAPPDGTGESPLPARSVIDLTKAEEPNVVEAPVQASIPQCALIGEGSSSTGVRLEGNKTKLPANDEIVECPTSKPSPVVDPTSDASGPLPGAVSVESTVQHYEPLQKVALSMASLLSTDEPGSSSRVRRSRDMARVVAQPLSRRSPTEIGSERYKAPRTDTESADSIASTSGQDLPASGSERNTMRAKTEPAPSTDSIASTSGPDLPASKDQPRSNGSEASTSARALPPLTSTSERDPPQSDGSEASTSASALPPHRQRNAPDETRRRTSLAGFYSQAAARRPLRVVRALVKKATSMLRVLTGRKEGSSIEQFRLHKVVGQGAFGVVHLCTKKGRPNRLYALKSMDKKDLLARQETAQALAEKEALVALSGHPFIVKTHTTFQDQLRLYFLMEFVSGGDLFDQLERHGKLSVEATRFYAAEIVVALEYMHAKGFLYRDLKIENVMLDASGHVKLTDLGFSRRCLPGEKRRTFVGTPDYLAPEIVNGKGHDKAVDFWAFGVLLFELMAGYAPFYESNQKELYRRISEGQFRFPSTFTKLVRDLIQNLLEVNPERRLGSGPRGWDDVKRHPWFQEVDWALAAKKLLKPPVVPPVYHHRKPQKYIDPLEVYRWHASPSGGLVLAGGAASTASARVHPDPTSAQAGPSSPPSTNNVFSGF